MSLNGFFNQKNQDGGKEEEVGVAEVGETENKMKTLEPIASEWIVGRLYADWCGHCISMKEAWVALKKDMEKEGKIKFIEIQDVEIETKLAELNRTYFPNKTGVKSGGFPTIFLFQTTNPEKTLNYFTKDRTLELMKKWVEEHTQKKGGKIGGKKGENRKTKKKQKKSKSGRKKTKGKKSKGRKTKGKKI